MRNYEKKFLTMEKRFVTQKADACLLDCANLNTKAVYLACQKMVCLISPNTSCLSNMQHVFARFQMELFQPDCIPSRGLA